MKDKPQKGSPKGGVPKKIPKCGVGLERGKRISTSSIREKGEESVGKKNERERERERERETSREILEITSTACALSSFASLSANASLIIHRPIIITCKIMSRLSR